MTTDSAVVGIYFVGLGVAAIAWGVSNLRRARKSTRERRAEAEAPALPTTGDGVMQPLCICRASVFCVCAIDGVRNPRGAGRGRIKSVAGVPFS